MSRSDDLKLLSLTLKGVIYRGLNDKGKYPATFDSYQIVKPRDFVFCLFDVDETPRTVGLSQSEGMITGAYDVFQVRGDVDSRYLYYQFLSFDETKQLKPLYRGLRKVIPSERFSALKLAFPPLNEQHQIARFLDLKTAQISKAIAAKRRLIELLDEEFESLILEKLRAHDRSDERTDSGVRFIGRIPRHWSTPRLASISSRRRERGRPHLDLLSVFLDRGVIPYSEGGGQVHKPSLDLDDYQRVVSGDLVLNNQQAWRGSVGVSHLEGLVSPAYIVLRMCPGVDPAFGHYLFRSPVMVDQFLVASRGVGTIQRQIYWPDLRNVRVPLPSKAEQASIAAEIQEEERPNRADRERAHRQIELLQEFRTAVIADAVTGKLDLSTADSSRADIVAEEVVEAAAAGETS